jgi:MFS transporter, AAHS family, 4-hydroxybenzoate transporter
LIGCTVFFSISALLTTQVTTIGGLQILRFITGLGLGSIFPGAIALAGEYSPLRKRVTLLTAVSVCFAVGGSIAGFVSAAVIPRWGWQSAFYVGGIAPAVLAILMLFYLPESMQFLAMRGKYELVGRWLKRIVPSVALDSHTQYRMNESNKAASSVAQLFTEGRARKTLVLWGANFLNLIGLYFLSNWLPTIAKESGLTISAAVLAGTALQVGGIVGSIVLGSIIDHTGFRRVLSPCFIVAGASIFSSIIPASPYRSCLPPSQLLACASSVDSLL